MYSAKLLKLYITLHKFNYLLVKSLNHYHKKYGLKCANSRHISAMMINEMENIANEKGSKKVPTLTFIKGNESLYFSHNS